MSAVVVSKDCDFVMVCQL